MKGNRAAEDEYSVYSPVFYDKGRLGGTRSYEFARYLLSKGHKVVMLTSAKDLRHIQEIRNCGLISRIVITA